MIDLLRLLAPVKKPNPGIFKDTRCLASNYDHSFDDILPRGALMHHSISEGEAATTHTIILVDESGHPDAQLGYMEMRQLRSDAGWYFYMRDHGLNNLWIDRIDIVSLVPHIGVGTALWEVSNRIIQPGDHRSIIDTSAKGWTKHRINEGVQMGLFSIEDRDIVENCGRPFRRYLLKYNAKCGEV